MRKLCLALLACVFILALSVNCVGQIGQPAETSLDIQSFSVSPAEISQGEPATLAWKVDGATSISIDQNIGQVDSVGTMIVHPDKTTTYKLTAKNSMATNSNTQTLTVKQATTPPAGNNDTNTIRRDFIKPGSLVKPDITSAMKPKIESFMVSPASIWRGDTASLFWVVKEAKSISIDNNIGTISETGTKVVKPDTDTKYTITAKNDFGTSTKEITVDVKTKVVDIKVVENAPLEPPKPPVIVDYTVAPEYSLSGAPVTLFWNVTGADSITMKVMCMDPYTMQQYPNLPVYKDLPPSSSKSVSMNIPIWNVSHGTGVGPTQQWVYLKLTATSSAGTTERDVAVLAEITR